MRRVNSRAGTWGINILEPDSPLSAIFQRLVTVGSTKKRQDLYCRIDIVMTGKLSAGLKLGDLNDYIAPSQACVVSLNSRIKNPTENGPLQKAPRILSDFSQADISLKSEPVKVTLHDCLACSGCITSAETVMLEQQSVEEFLNQLKSEEKNVVVSLSPQSRASLAAYFDITPLQAFKKISGFLKSLGVKAVFDTSFSRDLSLIEACEEFVTKYKNSPKTGSDSSSPILASACPGWICYAEKTHGSDIVPYISTVKSPQQVMGAVIKRHACHTMGLRPEDVYHVTVMPCYDKKLEASRDDFVFAVEREGETGSEAAGPHITEVDSVLTSGEILDLLKLKTVDFLSLEDTPIDIMLSNVDEQDHLYGVQGGSGSYADTIFRYAAKVLFHKDISGPLEYKTLRNVDFREISLEVDGKTVLRFACAYGFRNIQNLVRKIKMGKCEYDYVEIMACPAGCLNGGGQIKAKKGQSFKDVIQSLESAYLKEVDTRDPFDNMVARGLYDTWLDHPGSRKAHKILHTSYHQREKNVATQLSNW